MQSPNTKQSIELKFLDRVARAMVDRHKNDFSDVVVVLPAKRAKLFLREFISKHVGAPFWMPQFFILPEWIEYLGEKKISSEIDLLIFLYECNSKVAGDQEQFSVFIKWASLAIKDFNDIQASMVSPEKVFSDLKDIREIEGWSFNSTKLSSGQIEYMKFWTELSELYNEFDANAETSSIWTYQSILKNVLENISTVAKNLNGKEIYFVGIASMSAAEMKLVQEIQKSNSCHTYWDFDQYYVDHPMHEAGFFARRLKDNVTSLSWIENHVSSKSKHVTLNECTTSVSQALAIATQLKNLSIEELNETCVVMSDVAGLDTLLSVLSDIKVPVNIAAGIPLADTLPCKWFVVFLKMKVEQQLKSSRLHFQILLEWSQLLVEMQHAEHDARGFILELKTSNRVFYSDSDLLVFSEKYASLKPYLSFLFVKSSADEVLNSMSEFLSFNESKNDFVSVAGAKLNEVVSRMTELSRNYTYLNNWDSISHLFGMVAAGERIFYEGQPIQGLQVLSMVETRALDFEHVFVMDANEDFLPGNTHEQSFIPIELRSHYGLPMSDEKEALYAYTFYRLLHHAKYIHLFYSSVSSSFKATEKSRYITQLENEFESLNAGHVIVHRGLQLKNKHSFVLSAENDDFAKSRLDQLFAHGISPSAINKFNQCPLDFYYRYIIGLGEEEVQEEQMSVSTFGTVVHYVLENFYAAFKGSFPSDTDFDQLNDTLDERLTSAIEACYSAHGTDTGYNLLARIVAKKMLMIFIQNERKIINERRADSINTVLEEIEFSLKREVFTSKYDWNKPVVMRGKGDRLDHVAGVDYILDYKTGSVYDKDIVMKDFDELFSKKGSGKQLQLMAYIYMHAAEGKEAQNIKAGFYSFTKHDGGYKFLNDEKIPVTNDVLEEFESAFVNWIKSIYQLEKFEHNPKSTYCQYCN